MKNILFKNTEITAYFLWEYTAHFNAIDLWYCTEDICYYLERIGILAFHGIDRMRNSKRYSLEYIEFVRNIAYRLYLYTKNDDHILNWFIAEKLLRNGEWCQSAVTIANIYRSIREDKQLSADFIKTEWIRKQL